MKQIILLLILVSSICYGQTKYDQHDSLIAEASTLKKAEKWKQAIIKYSDALEILIPNSSTPFFNIGECAINLEDFTLADEWIRKGVAVGGAPMSYLKKYKGFATVQDEEFYLKIISDYNKLRQQYFSTIPDIDLYLEIEELTSRDQFARKTGMFLDGYSEEDYQNASKEFHKARKENDTIKANEFKKIVFHKTKEQYKETTDLIMQKVDSLNVARLMEITAEHGWQERAWIILWHQRGYYGEDHYVWNYFKPLIDKEIKEGKLSRSFWSAFDQHKEMMSSGVFGTITIGEKPKEKIKTEKEKIKG